MNESNPQHWNSMAELWAQLGSPLRPCAQDQRGYERFIDPWIKNFDQPRILILGVTPELYHLAWPKKRELIALDRARRMIDEVWPGPKECAVQGDWLQMPFPPASRDLVLCDGGPILLAYPSAQQTLVDQVHRLLVPGGRAIFRTFIPPAVSESKETVLDDLAQGRIANLNILKMRLGMAMQPSVDEGVAINDVLHAIESVDSDLKRLAERLGWTWDHMRVIEVYRNSPARYHFVSEELLTRLFCHDGRFALVGRWQGTYPLAERCPIVAFERQHSPA